MAAADHGGPGPDLYQLLGVSRAASREEIAQAWRRRARDEHPDARPADAGAPGRFRDLAEAYQVLGDRVTPLVRVPGPPLRAGPVRVEGPRPAPQAVGWDEEDIRLAVLALRYLARNRGRPW
jgi:DnaJ domain